MKPHVKLLRKQFEARVKAGLIKAADHCCKCGKNKDEVYRLEIHHIIELQDVSPESSFDPNTQNNVTTLCNLCHHSWHKCYSETYNGSFIEWIENEPIDEVTRRVMKYREEKKAKSMREAAKHRARNQANKRERGS